MKLSKEVLAEIVAIFHLGLAGKDVSQNFRDLDLAENEITGELTLSNDYLSTHPRGGEWTEN